MQVGRKLLIDGATTIGLTGLLVLLAVLLVSPAFAAGIEAGRVGQVKAAFILNIAKFVGWPSGAAALSQPGFMLCYYREDILGSGAEIIMDKRVMGKPLARRLIDSVQQTEGCGVLLIPEGELDRFSAEAAEQSTPDTLLTIVDLTESGKQGQAYPGVVMNFVRRETSIGFEVDPAELARRGLTMSSELLKLARIVKAPEG